MMWIILSIVVIGAIGGIVYFIQSSKATLTLAIAETTVPGGTPLACTITLQTKRMVQCNEIILTLVGTKQLRENRTDGSVVTDKEVHSSRHIISGIKTFPPKHTATFSYELPTPAQKGARTNLLGSSIADEIKSSAKAGNSTKWLVEVKLDGNGVKLSDSQSVEVTTGS